jgi:outer membrane protein TolC
VVDEDIEGLARFKLQDMQIARGERVISKTKALKQPQANLNSYIGYNYDIDSSLNREYLWQIGVNLKWNIFDFGLRDSKLEQAKVSKLKAIVQREGVAEGFKKLLSKAIKQIDDAIVNYQTNLSKLNLLEESEKIEEARYGAGVATLNDLLLAKAKRELAKSKLIESKYSYQNGIFYLDYLFERGESE